MRRVCEWLNFATMFFVLGMSSLTVSAQGSPTVLRTGSVLVFENYLFDANKGPSPSGELVEYRVEAINSESIEVTVPSLKAVNFGQPVVFNGGKVLYSFTNNSQWLVKNKSTEGIDQFLHPRLKVGDSWKGPHPSHGSKLEWNVESEQPFKLGEDTLKALKVVGNGRWFGGGSSGKLRIEYLYSPEKQLLLGIHDDYMDSKGFGSTRGMKVVLKEIRD